MKKLIKKVLIPAALGLLAFCFRWLPTFLAYFKRGERVFLGVNSLANLMDVWVYWADIMVGRKGSWLLTNQFGNGPQARFLVKPLYVWLGRLTVGMPFSVEVIYLLAAFFLSAVLGLVLFRFSSLFFKSYRSQIFTTVITLFSGAISFSLPIEAVPFLSLLEPHFILAHITLVLTFYFFLTKDLFLSQRKKVKLLVSIFLVGLILSLMHFFMNWLVLTILIFWVLFFFPSWTEKKKFVSLFLVFGFSSLPMSVYAFYLSKNPIFFRDFIKQNVLISPSPFFILSQLGVFLFLIPFSLKLAKKNKNIFLLFTWLIVHYLFIYLPVTWQRHFIEGWWIPASYLASLGIFYLWKKIEKRALSLRIFWILIIFPIFFATNFSLLLIEIYFLAPLDKGAIYVSQKEKEAWDFLLPRCSADKIIIADWPRGGYLPAKTGCRSFVGHGIQTFDYYRKRAQLKKLVKDKLTPSDLEKFFIEKEINYVFLPRSKAEKTRIREVSHMKLIFENEEFMVYEWQ